MIQFHDAAFSGSGKPPLRFKINAEFSAGRRSVIVGTPDGGADLVIRSIVGQHQVDRGRVLVSGLDPSVEIDRVRRRLTLVPTKVPVREHFSPVENVRYLLLLKGCDSPGKDAIITALRMAELREASIHSRSASCLGSFERLGVWLAVHQLSASEILILEELDRDMPAIHALQIADLLCDATSRSRTVVATCRDTDFGALIGQDVFQIDRNALRLRSSRRSTLAAPVNNDDADGTA